MKQYPKMTRKKKPATRPTESAPQSTVSPKGDAPAACAQPDADIKRRAGRIHRKLLKLYPDADCALIHDDPFQLLVSTILSAQCTDKRVNMVTPDLFRKYPTPVEMAAADSGDLERLIRTTGFFRNKAKSLKGASQAIVDQYEGVVPDTMDQLLELHGVARKTANVVLGNAFGKNEGVVVDTHVGRLAQRMGFTGHKSPPKIERDLMALFPRKGWAMLAHLLIHHGRAVCTARNPACDQCQLAGDCPRNGVATEGTA